MLILEPLQPRKNRGKHSPIVVEQFRAHEPNTKLIFDSRPRVPLEETLRESEILSRQRHGRWNGHREGPRVFALQALGPFEAVCGWVGRVDHGAGPESLR